jgi:hypothetical protein
MYIFYQAQRFDNQHLSLVQKSEVFCRLVLTHVDFVDKTDA